MKKIFMSLIIIVLFTSCDPAEKITIRNDTELLFTFQFPQEEINVNPNSDYSFMVIGLYSEEHREYLEDRLKNITGIKKSYNGITITYNTEEVKAMIKKSLVYLDDEWIILCSKLK